MGIRSSAFLITLFSALAACENVVAQECTAETIALKFPPAIVVPMGETVAAAISREIGCQLNPVAPPWEGVTVVGASGKQLGISDGMLIPEDPGLPGYIRFSNGNETLAIGTADLERLRAGQILKIRADAQPLTTSSGYVSDPSVGDVKVKAYQQNMLLAGINLFNPYGDLLLLYVDSVPNGAKITINGQEFEETGAMLTLQSAYLENLVVKKEGYSPCEFRQGSFKRAPIADSPSTFFCELVEEDLALE